jgi:hypothetical protein
MSLPPTWKPYTAHGFFRARNRGDLPDSAFAFPAQRKEPLTDAAHVRMALARFPQVRGVTDIDRDLAFENIRLAAQYYGVSLPVGRWEELSTAPAAAGSDHSSAEG